MARDFVLALRVAPTGPRSSSEGKGMGLAHVKLGLLLALVQRSALLRIASPHRTARLANARMQQPAVPLSEVSAAGGADDGSVLLSAEELSQTYDGQKYQFRDVGLTIARGAKIGLVGDNGAGKSTLFKVRAKAHYLAKQSR